jgi:hypothetical protein
MDVQTLTFAFRGGERLLIVAVAALCIWLGYKLFQSLPTEHGSGGTLKLPNAKLVLSKVGPGVFFALFGTVVLGQSVWTQASAPANVPGAEKAGQLGQLTYGVSSGAASADPQALRHVQDDIQVLNCLARVAPEELGPGAVERALHNARVLLLATAWQPAWGDTAFASLKRGEIPASGPITEIYNARASFCPAAGGPKQ